MPPDDAHPRAHLLWFGAVLAGVGLFGGCGPKDVWFESRDGAAVILVVLGAGEAQAWSALPDEGAERIALDLNVAQTFYLLEYAEPLAEPLPAGALSLELPPGGTALTRPTRIFEASVSDGEFSDWQLQPTWPSELERVRLAGGRDPCLNFETRIVEVPDVEERRVTVAIPLGGDRIVLGTDDAKLYAVDLSLSNAVTATGSIQTAGGLVAGALWKGELWFLASDGMLVHGSLETGFVEGPPLPLPSIISDSLLLASRPGEADELVFWSGEHVLFRFDGTSWEELSRSPDSGEFARAVRLGPDDFLASSDALQGGVLRVKNGEASFEKIDGNLGVRPFSMARSDALGILLGAERGQLFQRQEGIWAPMMPAEGVGRLHVVVPWRGDLIVGGSQGIVAQYVPGWGTCEVFIPFAADVFDVVPLEHALFLRHWTQTSLGLSAVFIVPEL